MTEMKRMSISLPSEIEAAIVNLRKKDEYCKCSYSEIIRILIAAGLKSGTIEQDTGEEEQ